MLSGKGLYQINNVVDVNNLVSLESLQPLGAYDLDQARPPIQLRTGALGETYKGAGKDLINIESLPVFVRCWRRRARPLDRSGSWLATTALWRHRARVGHRRVAAIRPNDSPFSLKFAFPLTRRQE